MRAVGIICEYNPFPRGHAWHLREAKRLSGADAAVCVMSGVCVQRGEPALLREHARGEAAVCCGADLVLALPVPWAMASAARFAMGGLSVLEGLGVCDTVSFGSECGDTDTLCAVAAALEQPAADEMIRSKLSCGISYAAAREAALRELGISGAQRLRDPNDTLGIEYISAIRKLGSAMNPLAVRRVGKHDGGEAENGFASASYVRGGILSGEDVSPYLPDEMNE
ncbi:MAG: nucleotidyltransferase family protein, partial [Clostridia bacterium]|nr:nucleotidyltransferase family protein [Clostridia bacterium]